MYVMFRCHKDLLFFVIVIFCFLFFTQPKVLYSAGVYIITSDFEKMGYEEIKEGDILKGDYVIKTDKNSNVLIYFMDIDINIENEINGIKIHAPLKLVKEDSYYPIICGSKHLLGISEKVCSVKVIGINGKAYISKEKVKYERKEEKDSFKHKIEEYLGVDLEIVEDKSHSDKRCNCKVMIFKVKTDGIAFKNGIVDNGFFIEGIGKERLVLCREEGTKRVNQVLDEACKNFEENGELEIEIAKGEVRRKLLIKNMSKK